MIALNNAATTLHRPPGAAEAVFTLDSPALFDRLIPAESPFCLSVIGGGGKTSLVNALGAEAQRRQMRTLLTTTTHMRKTPEADLSGEERTILRRIEENFLCFCGSEASEGKIGPLSTELFAKLYPQVSLTLTEADGSRGLPLKCPAEHEPVIPPQTGRIVLVVGMTAVGKPLSAVCHRWTLSGLEGDTIVTPEVVAEVLRRGYLRRFPLEALTVVFQQCDGPAELAAAVETAERLGIRGLFTKKF